MITPVAEYQSEVYVHGPPPPCFWDCDWLTPIEDIVALDQQFRRNSRKIKAHHNRVHQQMVHHVLHAAQLVGIERLGFLTVTNKWHRSHRATADSFDKARQEIRTEIETEWVRVVDQNADGKEHIHAIAVMDFDIAEGFNWAAQRELNALDQCRLKLTPKEKHRRQHLRSSVTTNVHLQAVWAVLKKILTRHGFGARLELNPVRNPIAAGRYLAGRYCAMIRRAKPGGPRVRRLAYTKNFPKSPEPFVSPGQLRYRKYLAHILGCLGLPEAGMRDRFGPNWAWQIILVTNDLRKLFLPDPATWPRDRVVEIGWRRLRPLDQSLWVPPPEPHSLLDYLLELKNAGTSSSDQLQFSATDYEAAVLGAMAPLHKIDLMEQILSTTGLDQFLSPDLPTSE